MSARHPIEAGLPSASVRVLAALDKFRGTATAADAVTAVGNACWELGHESDAAPLSDGGEGLLDVLGGANRTTVVTGPLGAPVEAAWRYSRSTAVIETARASGLELVGGADGNDPLRASTIGTGELIDRALDLGASRIVVGLGGSATTDGGLGAIDAIDTPARLLAVELRVACDVRTRFIDAAAVFAPQKGASAAEVGLLTGRLEQLALRYLGTYGVDVRELAGAGAAGGLAGGLAALGGQLVSGFDLVAEELDLHERVAAADVVVTGEGYLDAQSLDGKVVGGVCDIAADVDVLVLVVTGDADPAVVERLTRDGVRVATLVERFGTDRAMAETRTCIETLAGEMLSTT